MSSLHCLQSWQTHEVARKDLVSHLTQKILNKRCFFVGFLWLNHEHNVLSAFFAQPSPKSSLWLYPVLPPQQESQGIQLGGGVGVQLVWGPTFNSRPFSPKGVHAVQGIRGTAGVITGGKGIWGMLGKCQTSPFLSPK